MKFRMEALTVNDDQLGITLLMSHGQTKCTPRHFCFYSKIFLSDLHHGNGICSLLFCSKLLWNSATKNKNIYYLTQLLKARDPGVALAHKVAVKLSTGIAIRSWPGKLVCLLADLGFSVLCCLLSRGCSSSTYGFFTTRERERERENPRWKLQSFIT